MSSQAEAEAAWLEADQVAASYSRGRAGAHLTRSLFELIDDTPCARHPPGCCIHAGKARQWPRAMHWWPGEWDGRGCPG